MSSPHYSLEIECLILEGLDLTPLQAEQLRRELSLTLSTRLSKSGNVPEPMVATHLTLPALEPAETRHVDRLASGLSERIAGMLSGNKQVGRHA
jgi:hypothetical protein